MFHYGFHAVVQRAPSIFSHPLSFFLSLSSNNRMHPMIAAACCALEHSWTCCIHPDVQRLEEEDALQGHFYAGGKESQAFLTGGFLKGGRNE